MCLASCLGIGVVIPQSHQLQVQVTLASQGCWHKSGSCAKSLVRMSMCFCSGGVANNFCMCSGYSHVMRYEVHKVCETCVEGSHTK